MRSCSSTSVIEMEPVRLAPSPKLTKIASSPLPQELLRNDELAAAAAVEDDELPPPSTASSIVQRWNYPRSNMPKVAACFWSFIVIGANDAAYGVGLDSLLSNCKGGMPVCHLIAYLIIALHPPYPVLVIAFMIAGYGNGLADAAWNAWIGNMDHANEILGFLHGLYGLSAVISPLVATSMVTKANLPWYTFYYLMLSLAGLELVTSMVAFWKSTASAYRSSMSHSGETQKGSLRNALTRRPSARVTWLCALFLLGYVGIEVALGGWIVVFMIQVRHGEEFASGMTATGFWLGIAIGRIYLPIVMGLELLFWLVPQFTVSAVAVSLQGFFLGPLFPAAIVAMSKLLPRHLHVGAIGFAAAFGSSGAAILPFAVGAIAQAKGVQVLQPIILALLAAIFVLWLGLPKFGGKKKE
ncbi:putative Major facilitator superfamily (MFS) profile domain-containing protein [Seiridium unicorne]|uniref:Major facilitator superfamily (MFS) profile domain-containing protein n=1 Tax=Seiridium unicorne TaxID=138068 RepID=A0ABR2VE90_9PEZI